ncbi:unnamed protein product [Larinioides sclopetarius]|uniref:Uncharacterized protein n=1 Tax=Larinioides sclopetarius TaxID=280406 RepID=A0AAV2B0R9_9ARAC
MTYSPLQNFHPKIRVDKAFFWTSPSPHMRWTFHDIRSLNGDPRSGHRYIVHSHACDVTVESRGFIPFSSDLMIFKIMVTPIKSTAKHHLKYATSCCIVKPPVGIRTLLASTKNIYRDLPAPDNKSGCQLYFFFRSERRRYHVFNMQSFIDIRRSSVPQVFTLNSATPHKPYLPEYS